MYALAIYTPILTVFEARTVECVGYFLYRSAKKEDHVEHHYQVRFYELIIVMKTHIIFSHKFGVIDLSCRERYA